MTQETNQKVSIALDDLIEELKGANKVEEYLQAEELSRRELYISDIVDTYLIKDVVAHILRWNKEDDKLKSPIEGTKPYRKPITVYVDTYGGDTYTCLAIISSIKSSKTPVHTVNLQKAISAGSLIFLAGHKRFSYRNSFILIHEGESGYVNQTSKTRDHFKFQEKVEARIKDHVLASSNITSEKYDEMYKHEWYIFGDECLELGMVDELLD